MRRALLLAVLALAPPAWSADDGARLLERAYHAKAAYTATLRVRLPSSGDGESLVRVSAAGGRRRMEYLSGPSKGRILVDDGKRVFWLDPSSRTATLVSPARETDHLPLLLSNYRVAVTGQATVAGRRAAVLKITPKRPPGPSRTLWVDRATGVPLRTDSLSSEGRVLSSSAVTSVRFGASVPPSLFALPRGYTTTGNVARGTWTRESLAERLGMPLREPKYLPPGFKLDEMGLAQTGRGAPSVHFRYTDGLNSLSLFQHQFGPGHGRGRGPGGGRGMGRGWRGGRGPARVDRPGECLLLAGGVGRSLRVFGADRVYLLVGDLPEATLRKVADSLP